MVNKPKTLVMTQFSILLALEMIACFTPLGSLPVGPIVATLAGVPVVAAGILLGIGPGAALGAFAGLFSLAVWTFTPPQPPIAFVFTPFYSLGDIQGNIWSLCICFIPRIMIGVTAGAVYKWLSRMIKPRRNMDALAYGISGALGSLANTFLALGGIYIFFGRPYAEASGMDYTLLLKAIGVVVLTNGIMEAVICALAAYGVCKPVKKYVLRG